MIANNELESLIEKARAKGARIGVSYDGEAYRTEGRKIIARVSVAKGIPGCGPFPMSPIAAAERLRSFIATGCAK